MSYYWNNIIEANNIFNESDESEEIINDNKPYDKIIEIKYNGELKKNISDIDIKKTNIKNKIKNKKYSLKRCNHIGCKNKLTLIDLQIKCKCNVHFCQKHMNPHNHMCDYDNKMVVQERIKKNNPLCSHSKIDKI